MFWKLFYMYATPRLMRMRTSLLLPSVVDELLRENAALRARLDFLAREYVRLKRKACEPLPELFEAQLLTRQKHDDVPVRKIR